MNKILTILVIFAVFASIPCIAYANEIETLDTQTTAKYQSQISDEPTLKAIYVQTFPQKTVYRAFELLDTAGLSVRAVYDDGSESTLPNEKLDISYLRDRCFRVGDDGVTVSYGGKSAYISVTVERISYDLSEIITDNFSVEYNGKHQSYRDSIPTITGLDGVPLTVRALGGGTDVGSYSITLDFSTTSRDYLTPDSRIITMTVTPAVTDITWTNQSFVYDGKSKIPTASYTDVSGAVVYPSVYGAAIEAGDNYVATASVNDPNYVFHNTTTAFEIEKATYNLSSVRWSSGAFTYDGSEKRVDLLGLPDGVSIVSYNFDRARAAGKYTATATLSWDKRNYNEPGIPSHNWEILPATYDMSGVKILPAVCVFDGRMHYPTIEGALPVGADGIMLEYSFSTGAIHVNEGIVSVDVIFSTKSPNYIAPSPVSSAVSISPKPIFVSWSSPEISYTGASVAPAATSFECGVTVSGAAVNVGSYTATAIAENSDFLVENKDFSYKITKAVNSWITVPVGKTCYESRIPTGFGEAKFGILSYRFFSDPECKNEISPPRREGKYFAIAEVAETSNYSALKSQPFSFVVERVKPVGISISISKPAVRVFDKLTPGDFTSAILNNDGSTLPLDSALVEVIYESSDSISLADSYVSFRYKDYTEKVQIYVQRAIYDLASVSWSGSVQTYDGKPKSPMLVGLPNGVRVVSYVGAGVTESGEYTITAILEYDSENYLEPEIPPCKMVIKKQSVATPTIILNYSGKPQTPVSNSYLYTISGDLSFTDAGEYEITVTLTDPRNYSFSKGNSSECNATLKILPRTLAITVPDVRVHLFEKPGSVDYIVTENTVLDGDTVNLVQYSVGEYIAFSSDNPNYRVEQTGGKITYLGYPSVRGTLLILLLLLVLVIVIMLSLICYRYRHTIFNAFAALRCRWKNRAIIINSPTLPKDYAEKNRFEPYQYENRELPRKNREEPRDLNSFDTESIGQKTLEISKQDEEKAPKLTDTEPEPDSDKAGDTSDSSDAIGQITVPEGFGIDVEHADDLITDSLAKNLVRKDGDVIYTDGSAKNIINVDTLSEHFCSGERIDINVLKYKSLIPYDTAYVKVLARGVIDKPLKVYANDFSLSAVKMIALTGGEAIKTATLKIKDKNNQNT